MRLATLIGALLDGLTHHAHILLFNGESYRFRQSQQRLTDDVAAAADL